MLTRDRGVSTCVTDRTRLLGGVGEPLRDQSCVDYAALRSALANHIVPVFNLAGVNVVDLLVVVILTDPFRRAVVRTGLLCIRTHITNSQSRVLLTGCFNSTFPARLLRLGGLLREHRRCQREGKYQREQQSELLLQHFFSPYHRDYREDVMCSTNTGPRGPKRASFKLGLPIRRPAAPLVLPLPEIDPRPPRSTRCPVSSPG